MATTVKSASRRAIERLHRRDMQASKDGDFETLRSLVDDEAVMFPPGAAAQRGAKDFDAAFLRMRSAPKTHEVLEYRMEFEDVKIFGNYAIEWGTIRGATRDLSSGRVTQSEYHVMRVLRRKSDGHWKVYRSIWTSSGGAGSG
jgi:ketosteroid isomerase-like protein